MVILYETGRWHDNDLVVMGLRELGEWVGSRQVWLRGIDGCGIIVVIEVYGVS